MCQPLDFAIFSLCLLQLPEDVQMSNCNVLVGVSSVCGVPIAVAMWVGLGWEGT